jgi:hypothetical protein
MSTRLNQKSWRLVDCVGIEEVSTGRESGVSHSDGYNRFASCCGRYGVNMKRLLANLRICDSSQCMGSMRHINDELINGTHTYSSGRGREGRSNLRRNCKILIGVKGELRKEGATYTYNIF